MKRLLVVAALLLTFGMVNAQTLVYGTSGFPSSLDAADSQDGNSLVVSGQITERLVDFAPGGTDLIPALATSWTPNDDATVWTFELRQGVKFHDGTPFNAEAVKFNIDRWNDPNSPVGNRAQGKTFVPWGWVFGGPVGEGNKIASVDVTGEYTVQINTTAPVPFLPALFAAGYFQFGSPAAITAAGVNYGTPNVGAVGTGPFKFVEWVEGERVVVERNADYWGGPAGVERVVFRGIQEPTARLAELQAGTIDIAVLLTSDDLTTVKNDPNLTVQTAEGEMNVGYIGMSQLSAPMDNVLVRQAVAYAIDREAIVDAFYEGLGIVAQDHLPPSMFGHGKPWPYEYNPEKAKELLADAGYPNGLDVEFWYMPVSRPYFPSPQPIAEAVASYLADVGIRAELKTEDWTTYLADYPTGKFPMYMLGWNADYADPENFLLTFFGPDHSAAQGWDNPDVLEALAKAGQIGDQDERAALYASVVDAVADAAASIPMAHNVSLNATRKNISGWIPSPLGFSSVSLHPVTKTE
ncbi:MAG: ABC transporter substrate-binding protein [Trueperaceae bacterium]|nr:ABC transporter substrate-binding protein [Trueperaceae bacterium]MCC6309558.1 ABC transporter substrate-binding protein [Trueperaceae bacterium]